MKWVLIIIFSAVAIFGIVKKNSSNSSKSSQIKRSVNSFAVLELFTSEGCSSCPPADRLLPQLEDLGPNVIPLSFHVDYWNNNEWNDPFSHSEFSDRQKEYAKQFKLESIYTPQLVINGEYEMVGSERLAAEHDIQKLLEEDAKVKILLDDIKKEGDEVEVNCSMEGQWQKEDLLTAIVQKHAEMNVKGGENKGAKLSHTNVVRSFTVQEAKEKMSFKISISHEIANDNWQLVMYTREKNDLKITGVATYLPTSGH